MRRALWYPYPGGDPGGRSPLRARSRPRRSLSSPRTLVGRLLGWLGTCLGILLGAEALEADPERRARPEFRLGLRLQVMADAAEGAGGPTLLMRRNKVFSHLTFPARHRLKLQVDVAREQGFLDDAYMSFWLGPGYQLWVGRFKADLSRESEASSRELLFTERSLAARAFSHNLAGESADAFHELDLHGLGRAPGLRLRGEAGGRGDRDPLLRYTLGVGGDRGSQPFRSVRVAFAPRGDPGLAQGSDPDDPTFRLSLEAAYVRDPGAFGWDLDGDGRGGTPVARELRSLGLAFRRGRVSGQWERFGQELEAGLVPGRRSTGSTRQLGYALEPGRLELGVRASRVDPGDDPLASIRRETSLALTRYLEGHGRKLVLEHGRFEEDERPGQTERRWRVMYQQVF